MSDSEELISSEVSKKSSAASDNRLRRSNPSSHGQPSLKSERHSQTPSIRSGDQVLRVPLSPLYGPSLAGSRTTAVSASHPGSRAESRTESVFESRTYSKSDSLGLKTGEGCRRIADFKNLPKRVQRNITLGATFGCGGMSTIRKYFCLFVIFDLVTHSLVYLNYLQHANSFPLTDLLTCQLKCYDMRTSFMDVLLITIIRFIVLETCYGIQCTSSWAPVAISTAVTCVLIIIKPFYYDWDLECQRLSPITLMILSFALSWFEAFLVDFRLLNMEDMACKFAEAKPDSYKKDLQQIKMVRAIGPITGGLLRNLLIPSNSLTLVPCPETW